MGGDGIGPEVVAEGLKVIDALGIEYERIDPAPLVDDRLG